jgi:FkbM family methyltransferase
MVLVHGHRMLLHAHDRVIAVNLEAHGTFEPFETELVDRLLQPGDTVFDLGANIGYYTLLFARRVGPEGRVFAFEPEPDNYRLLQQNVQMNGYRNVTLVPMAVSDWDQELQLFLCDANKGDHRAYDSGDGRPSVVVRATRLDSFFQGWEGKVALIKMDIQGSEWKALKGMRALLQRQEDVTLLTEFWPLGLRTCGAEPAAFLQLLGELGFTLYQIDDVRERLTAADPADLLETYLPERDNFTNLLCVRSLKTLTRVEVAR